MAGSGASGVSVATTIRSISCARSPAAVDAGADATPPGAAAADFDPGAAI